MASRRLAVAAYASAVAAYMYGVGSVGFWLPLHARDLGFSYTEVNLLATFYFAALIPGTLLAGVAADVTGRPRGLLASSLAGAALTAALLPLARSFPSLALLRAVQALALSMILPIATGALTVLLGVRRGVGAAAALNGAGMAVGAIAGGLLYSRWGFAPIAYSMAGAAAASAALVAAAPPPPRPPVRVGLGDVAAALARAPAGVKVVLAALVARNTLATGAFAVLSIIFSRLAGLTPLETGVALAVNPLAQFLLAAPVSWLAAGREARAYPLGILLTAAALHLYRTAHGLADAVLAQATVGAAFSLIHISANNYVISRMPPETRYTAASLFPLAFNLGWITGTAAAGPYMDAHGVYAWLRLGEAATAALALATAAALEAAEARARPRAPSTPRAPASPPPSALRGSRR